MNKYVLAIIVGLIILTVATISIWIICLKYKKDKSKWDQIAKDSYNRGKNEADAIVRATCDKIEEDKVKLNELSERELLVKAMLALGTYARRMDRINEELKCLADYKSYIDKMNKHAETLSKCFKSLDSNISSTNSIVDLLQKTVQDTSAQINQLVTDFNSFAELHVKIDNHIQSINGVEESVSYIYGKVTGVIEDMDKVMNTYDESPMTKLKDIQSEISDLLYAIGSIQDAVSSVSNNTADIKTILNDSMEEYSYGSLFNRISDITSSISSLQTEIGSVNSNVQDIKSTVEGSLSSYGYDSLYSKLGDISSDVSSILSKVE